MQIDVFLGEYILLKSCPRGLAPVFAKRESEGVREEKLEAFVK